ncbi:MAG: thiamine-phosphate kinase [Planctomycetota bacterium]
MDETWLLAHIYERSVSMPDEVLVGPGDDCAVTRNQGKLLLTTVDQLVATRHFDPGLLDDSDGLDLVARKAVARSISDIAAMGGRPAWGLATGLLPDGCSYADRLFDAMQRWAAHFGAPLVGGDIAFGPGPLVLTVTVGGTMPDGVHPVLRSGAQPGQGVYVSGSIGGSYESGWHLRFEPRLELGETIARAADGGGAMMDLSDGLGREAGRIGEASGVVVEIEAALIPMNHRCATWREAAGAGEDYELLFTLPDGVRLPASDVPIARIGTVREGGTPGAVVVDPHGVTHDVSDLGWSHG